MNVNDEPVSLRMRGRVEVAPSNEDNISIVLNFVSKTSDGPLKS